MQTLTWSIIRGTFGVFTNGITGCDKIMMKNVQKYDDIDDNVCHDDATIVHLITSSLTSNPSIIQ